MFEAISKAILDVQEKDEENIQKRRSKRMSAKHDFGGLHVMDDDEVEKNGEDKDEADKTRKDRNETIGHNSLLSDSEEDDDDLLENRDKWENNNICVVHMIAFAVGGSNVWRFGFLCYEYGGAAFLIPYLFFTLVCALPCVYLELLVGQYAQVGAIAAWKLAPIFKGVGKCMILVCFMSCFNMQSMLAWTIFYMFQTTFHNPLPWISCDNGFGKNRDGSLDKSKVQWIPVSASEKNEKNWHTENCSDFYADADEMLGENERLPGTEYFRGRVQRMWMSYYADSNFNESNGQQMFGLDSPQPARFPNTDTFCCLIIAFATIKLFARQGIGLNAKIMAVLTISPYIILIMLLYRATGLHGAWSGLMELFRPNVTKLVEPTTWWKCAEQVFYSTGSGFGIHLTLASHKHFNSGGVLHDAAVTVIVNSVTSLLSACTVFMFLGHVKGAVNRDLRDFVRSGPELMFEAMADVLGVLAKANYYAFTFYFFLFLVTISTVITIYICGRVAYLETLPVSLKYRTGPRTMLLTILQLLSIIVSSLNLTRGGLHTYNYINAFTSAHSIILCAFMFLIGIVWFFGLREIVDATSAMGVSPPGIFFQICWKFVSPVVLAIVFFGLGHSSDSHEVIFDQRKIPLDLGLKIVGYIVGLGPLLMVIIGAVYAMWITPGKTCKQKILTSISPTSEHYDILATGTGKRAKFSHYFYLFARTHGTRCNDCCTFRQKSKVGPTASVEEPDAEELGYNEETRGFGGEQNTRRSLTVP